MFCTKCGYKLKDDDLFCGNCGAKISAEATQEQAARRPVSTADVTRAEGIDESSEKRLEKWMEKRPAMSRNGAEVITGFAISWLLWPIYAINPLFWFANYYKFKAKNALSRGDVPSAQKLKEKSTKFTFAGWALIVVVFVLVLVLKD